MRVAFGTDHAGYELKERLKRDVAAWGHQVADFGTYSTEPVDYPDFCFRVGEAVARGDADRGIVLGGSGNGEGMAANKVVGVRATVVTSDETARLARLHNDANVLALGARTNPDPDAIARWVRIWLDTEFEGGRHVARLRKIADYERRHAAGAGVERV
jgi:ribose 5-phosphate isomerase B